MPAVTAMDSVAPVKPRLRGWMHLICAAATCQFAAIALFIA